MPERPDLATELLRSIEDERAARLVASLAAIDREVRRYKRKVAGLEPWSTFEIPKVANCCGKGCSRCTRMAA